ncbi:unnamed protein product [Amoebophrya sp. A120]|nr:unnamed protein product [Amoebophrya sp. A120]|eukprot:GSA120T00009298001.1
MAMFGVSAAAGAIFKVATGTKRAIDFLQSFNGVEEEGYVLWKTLEALTIPVQVAEKLLIREEALPLLLPSTKLIRFQIRKVEEILDIGSDEDDERPDSKESWTKWLKTKKDGKDRRERIAEMLPKLNAVISLLNLGLQTLSVQPQLCKRVQQGAPFAYSNSVTTTIYNKAKRLLQEFLFGRCTSCLLCCGELWEQKGPPSGKGSNSEHLGKADVWLVLDEEKSNTREKKLLLKIKPNPDDLDEEDSGESWEDVVIPLAFKSPSTFARMRPSDASLRKALNQAHESDLADVCYKIQTAKNSATTHYFEFTEVVEISCEVFEAAVVLAKYTHSLANDFPAEESKFSTIMKQYECPYSLLSSADELANKMAVLDLQ